MTITNPLANSISNYVMKFNMNKLPFDNGMIIRLSTKHIIQNDGRCFVEIFPNNILGYGIECVVINPFSIQLNFMGDSSMMLLSSINYTVKIVNVLNPPYLIPFTYKV